MENIQAKQKKKKGFTLIELIIVIAILGILALIAIPKFGSAQKDAKIKADIATGKTIADTTAALIAKGDKDLDKFKVAKGISLQTPILDQLGGKTAPKAQLIKKADGKTGEDFYVEITNDLDVKVYVGADEKNQVYPEHTGEYAKEK